MRDVPTFEEFCGDPQLLGEPISKPWSVFFAAMDGLSLDAEGVQIFCQCTGRDRYEARAYTDSLALCGRRSEKTASSLKYLIWKSLYAGWDRRPSFINRIAHRVRVLRVPLIAQDLRVAADIKRMAEALVMDSPLVSREVADVRATEIVFRNGIALTCFPASKASVRGLSCPGALLDEIAFVSIDGADDRELVRQLKPAMVNFGDARRLIKATTPWQRSGVAFSEFSQRALRADILVWQAATQFMTPRVDAADLEAERRADPVYYAREFEAQFVADVEGFLPEADVRTAVGLDGETWTELPPQPDLDYVAALDASALSGGDRFTFGIAARGQDKLAVCVLRGWRKAPVPQVMDEIATLAKAYCVRRITADQFGFSFVNQLLAQRGVECEQLAFSARSKPEVFFALKNALAQGRLLLPDHPEALRELRMLESVRTSGGNYRISAPRGSHDDYATVIALLAHRGASRATHKPWVEVIDCGPRRASSLGR